MDEELEKVELQRGQNVFFFNVTKVTLSSEMVKLLRTATPSLFVTYGFYDFALSITPVVEGTRLGRWALFRNILTHGIGLCLTILHSMLLKWTISF